MAALSRRKGASFEREVANRIGRRVGAQFRRNPQGAGAARQGPDIEPIDRHRLPEGARRTLTAWIAHMTWIECKRRGTNLPAAEIEAALDQDRGRAEELNLLPAVIWRRDRGPTILAISLDDLLREE